MLDVNVHQTLVLGANTPNSLLFFSTLSVVQTQCCFSIRLPLFEKTCVNPYVRAIGDRIADECLLTTIAAVPKLAHTTLLSSLDDQWRNICPFKMMLGYGSPVTFIKNSVRAFVSSAFLLIVSQPPLPPQGILQR